MKHVIAALFSLAMGIGLAAQAHATPSPNEEDGQRKAEFLYHVHQQDPNEHRSQDQLLAEGYRVCAYRRAGHENTEPTALPALCRRGR